MNEEQIESWSNNPQTEILIQKNNMEEETEIFISLGQNDGRLIADEHIQFPYPNIVHPICICLFKIENNETLP